MSDYNLPEEVNNMEMVLQDSEVFFPFCILLCLGLSFLFVFLMGKIWLHIIHMFFFTKRSYSRNHQEEHRELFSRCFVRGTHVRHLSIWSSAE